MRAVIASIAAATVLATLPARAQDVPAPDGAPASEAARPPMPPPEPETPWWKNYTPPPQSSGIRIPIAATGGALAGVGALTLFASGVAALVGSGEAAALDTECPDHRCIEGSTGARTLESARDSIHAAEILAAIGFPTVAGGLTMVAIGVAAGRRYSGKIAVGPSGLSVSGEF
jgi:hypothetical protein